jgi:alkylhydroperoxidase family enzyme
MARVPLLPADIAEPGELVASIRARRGGRLLNLDRMLLVSPPFAAGWGALLREVRGNLKLPAELRELAILLVGVLNRADYEVQQHASEYLAAGGTQAKLEALTVLADRAADSPLFDATDQAVLRAATEMTRGVLLSDAGFAALREALGSERQVVEMIGVIATYNMVSRFLVALQIDLE